MRVLLLGVVLLALLPGPAAAEPAPIRFPAMQALVAKISGHPEIDTYCEDAADWSADKLRPPGAESYAWWRPGGSAGGVVLRGDVCGGAALALADPNEKRVRGYMERKGDGLLTLIHEAMHLQGEGDWDEGRVECSAIRSVRDVAVSLGADERHADQLYAAALTAHLGLPPAYRTVC